MEPCVCGHEYDEHAVETTDECQVTGCTCKEYAEDEAFDGGMFDEHDLEVDE